MDWTACVLRLYQPEFDPRVSTRGKDPSHVPINATRLEWTLARYGLGPPPYPPLLPRVYTLIATELLSNPYPDIARQQNPGRFWWCRCLLIPTGFESQSSKPLLPGSNPNGEGQSDVAPSSPLAASSPPFASAPVHWQPLLKMKMEAGENLPEEVLCCISEWCSVLEDRNIVPGGSLGHILGSIAAFKASLASSPGTHSDYSPFVSNCAFIYPGFVAAGKEIEQPFGALHPSLCWLRREQLVDLGIFCQVIMTRDIESLQSALCLNAYLGPEEPELICHRSMTLTEATAHDEFKDISDEEVGSPGIPLHPRPSYLGALRASPRIFISVRLRHPFGSALEQMNVNDQIVHDNARLSVLLSKLRTKRKKTSIVQDTCSRRYLEIVGGSILPPRSPAFDFLRATHLRQPSSRHCSTTIVQTPWCTPGQLVEVEKGEGDRGRG
ncbi:hypothetical protein B0H14DRAFT_3671906 [Mycena olivaceomarginata]|nr:hypothetical protein B0H14DRAFT_3671906 [Mycena olivaceomarginata]